MVHHQRKKGGDVLESERVLFAIRWTTGIQVSAND